ncbi:hypothetical protein RI367_001634 [Sorochytrium milnesiophthora]
MTRLLALVDELDRNTINRANPTKGAIMVRKYMRQADVDMSLELITARQATDNFNSVRLLSVAYLFTAYQPTLTELQLT